MRVRLSTLILLISSLLSCEESSKSPQTAPPASSSLPTAPPRAGSAGSFTNQNGATVPTVPGGVPTAPANITSDADEVNLPSHLLRRSELQTLLNPIFLPEQRPPPTEPNTPPLQDPLLQPMQTFLQSLTDQALRAQVFQPGRPRLPIYVTRRDDQPNGFMDMFHQMNIFSGSFIEDAQGLYALGVLCHEIGHSARNHPFHLAGFSGIPEFQALTPANPVNQKIDAYWARTYNPQTRVYTHDPANYMALFAEWQQVGSRAGPLKKKQESEADILGAVICGHLGLPLQAYIQFRVPPSILSQPQQPTTPPGAPVQLGAGERVTVQDEGEFITEYLFGYDTHPTDAERDFQLKRLSAQLQVAQPAAREFYASYAQNIPAFRARLGQAPGFFLSEKNTSPLKVVGISQETGKPITILRRHH